MNTDFEIQVCGMHMVHGLLRALEAIADPSNEDFDSHVRAREALKAFDAGESHPMVTRAYMERMKEAMMKQVENYRERKVAGRESNGP